MPWDRRKKKKVEKRENYFFIDLFFLIMSQGTHTFISFISILYHLLHSILFRRYRSPYSLLASPRKSFVGLAGKTEERRIYVTEEAGIVSKNYTLTWIL